MRTIKQGQTVPLGYVVVDRETGLPMNLAGVAVTARAVLQSGGAAVTLAASVVDEANGRVQVNASPLPVGDYNLEIPVNGPLGAEVAPTDRYAALRVMKKL